MIKINYMVMQNSKVRKGYGKNMLLKEKMVKLTNTIKNHSELTKLNLISIALRIVNSILNILKITRPIQQ